MNDLLQVPLFEREYRAVTSLYPDIAERRLVHEIVRRMINHVVTDLIQASAQRIASVAPQDIEDVRRAPHALIAFSDMVAAEHLALKRYLREHVYRHYRVLRMTNKAQQVVRALFELFFKRPELLPTEHHAAARQYEAQSGEAGRARAVADYIAGMTDRYAIGEYERLFDPAKRS